MKTIPLVLLAITASLPPVFSQNEKTPATQQSSASPARTYFPNALIVPQFTPPAPAERKSLPDIRIDASITVMGKSSHTVTLQRGEASTLPDLPPTEDPTSTPSPRKFTPEELAQRTKQRQHFISLGATVYDHKVSKIHWTDQESGETYQATCGFDVSLLAGIGSFVHDGESYQLLLMQSPGVEKAIRNPGTKSTPANPDIPDGKIHITQGNPNNTKATLPVHLIQEIIASEKDRLIAYQAARVKYQKESAAWVAAHPIEPQDVTFIFRPHRGSRYLTNPQPESKEGAR